MLRRAGSISPAPAPLRFRLWPRLRRESARLWQHSSGDTGSREWVWERPLDRGKFWELAQGLMFTVLLCALIDEHLLVYGH